MLAPASAAPAAAEDIVVETLFGGAFALSVQTDSEDLDKARARIEPRARELCKTAVVRWGRYQFDASSIVALPGQPVVTRLTFRQQITCDGAALLRKSAPPARTPDATPADRQAIERINAAFFAAKDRGDAAESWRLAGGKGLASFSSLAEWREQVSTFMQVSGANVRRVWRKSTWYRDPAGAEPGLYVAIDFVGESRQLAAVCGYVVWRRRENGNFDLTRIEENVIGREEIGRFRAEELEATLKRFGCK